MKNFVKTSGKGWICKPTRLWYNKSVALRRLAEKTGTRRRGIPVNICDCPGECDFYFPAICRTEELVAGLVGDGSDHARTARAAKAVRKTLEELEP